MEAKMNAWLDEMKDCQKATEAYMEDTGAIRKMLETKVEAYPERMEANQEKVEVIA
jgi:hypothetical protein